MAHRSLHKPMHLGGAFHEQYPVTDHEEQLYLMGWQPSKFETSARMVWLMSTLNTTSSMVKTAQGFRHPARWPPH
jgi:hypothetical protein